MTQCTIFDSQEDLEKITGLTDKELWNNGFNLDDWGIGFCMNKKLDHWWLENRLDCYDYDEIQYDEKWYYIVHH